MSRRTCAATKTLARSASGDFPPGLRVFRFRSTLYAPRALGRRARGCGWGSWEGCSRAFLEPSVVGLSPPSSGPVWTVSTLVVPPFTARGLLALFAVTETRQVIPRTPYAASSAPAASVRPPEPLLYRTGALPTAAPCLSCGFTSSVNLPPPRGCRQHPRSGVLLPRSLPPYRNTWPRPPRPLRSPLPRRRLPPRQPLPSAA